MIEFFKRFAGLQNSVVNSEKFVSALGGIIAIASVFYISDYWTGYQASLVILPSMGASTVLVFAVPHGQFSTPWALIGGNTISAIAGVSAVMLMGANYFSAGVAVGASIFLMHVLRCVHPPGGATALAAVIGGDLVHSLGYWYVITPTLLNCTVLMIVALVFNNLFQWRRYPQNLMRYQKVTNNPDTKAILPTHIKEAIARSEVVMDVSVEQIKRIIDKADEIMRLEMVSGFELELGAFYTNGLPGTKWSVRQVIDERKHSDPSKYLVVFRRVEGERKGTADSCTLQEFAEWSHEKMKPKNSLM